MDLKTSLEKNVKRFKKTIAKGRTADDKRFKLAQMIFGTYGEFYEVLEETDKISELINKNNGFDGLDEKVAKKFAKETILEVGDMLWYIINACEYLGLKSKLAVIETSLDYYQEKDVSPKKMYKINYNIFDSTKKYLFQFHDLDKYEKQFNSYISQMIKFADIIIKDVNNFLELAGVEKEYTLAETIDMVGDKLEKRYEGGKFDEQKSMQR
ncbi:MAG: hypothetical protein ACQEQF_00780 [Bacillota bacterium]